VTVFRLLVVDGRDLCQALRARGIDALVLFLTARDAMSDRLAGFSAGGDDYVTNDESSLSRRAARARARARADAAASSARSQPFG
jgi:two-component system, OmpR family, response regulator